MDPYKVASRGTPRLQEIHKRYEMFCAGLEDARPPLTAESQLWDQKMDEAMSVFDSEIRLTGRSTHEDEDDATLSLLGRQPNRVVPHRPKPTSIHRSLPHGAPIHATVALAKQGSEFDAEHKVLAKDAYRSLLPLVAPSASVARQAEDYYRKLEELKRHRFKVPPTTMEPVGTDSPRVAGVKKAEQPKPWRLEDSIWKNRPKWADSADFHDTNSMYERAFTLDWSRALRSHKLANFIMVFICNTRRARVPLLSPLSPSCTPTRARILPPARTNARGPPHRHAFPPTPSSCLPPSYPHPLMRLALTLTPLAALPPPPPAQSHPAKRRGGRVR